MSLPYVGPVQLTRELSSKSLTSSGPTLQKELRTTGFTQRGRDLNSEALENTLVRISHSRVWCQDLEVGGWVGVEVRV